jgi:hypothetical protein
LYNLEKPTAEKPEIAMNVRYSIPLSTTVSASPIVGGFAGYFKNGIKKMVNHMIAARTNVFFTVCPLGKEFLE